MTVPTPDVDLPGRQEAIDALTGEESGYCGPGWGSCGALYVSSQRAPDLVDAVLAAALPPIRRLIADEIDLARYSFGGCTDEYLEGMRMGARVARGGSDADL